jgi:MFS family permease
VQEASRISAPAQAPPAGRRLRLALLVIAAAQLMLVLDATILNVALPSIQRALRMRASDLTWVLTSFGLALGGLLLAGGRAGDLFGRRRVFRLGLVVFTLASLVGGLATSGAGLVAARVGQGVGAAMAAPTALSLLLPAQLVAAIGLGLDSVAATAASVRGVAPQDTGVAAGVINTTLQVGGVLGLAMLAAVAAGGRQQPATRHRPARRAHPCLHHRHPRGRRPLPGRSRRCCPDAQPGCCPAGGGTDVGTAATVGRWRRSP